MKIQQKDKHQIDVCLRSEKENRCFPLYVIFRSTHFTYYSLKREKVSLNQKINFFLKNQSPKKDKNFTNNVIILVIQKVDYDGKSLY